MLRMPHSIIIATHTPNMPQPKGMPSKYPKITRNSHMDNMEEIEVNFESPAARSAEGVTKLVAQRKGWAMEVTSRILNISGIISAGGEYIRTI